jgi:hypothetical protein
MTAPKLPEGLEPVAWGTTRTTDGKQILSEMCVATNPAYVKVHNQHLWEPLVRLSDAQAALQALAAEKDVEIAALKEDAARMDWLMQHTVNVRVHLRYGSRNLFWAGPEEGDGEILPSDLRDRIDSALLAAKEAKQ